ncbi:MAG: ASCH domain-containing protein [Patescibacteria group bacterium]|nr:ASCH domain-containing protein [Patescibacteria group bacterium]
MATYPTHRTEPYFSLVREGKKTIEVRLNRGKFKEMKPGDLIEVQNNEETDQYLVKIIDIRKYRDSNEMFENEDFKMVNPNASTIEETISGIREFYSRENEKKHGINAIEVQVVTVDKFGILKVTLNS